MMRVLIANLPQALQPEVLREVVARDKAYQRLMEAMKKDRKDTDRDKVPYKAVRRELGVLEERLSRRERIVIPEGRHKDYDMDLREVVAEELPSRGERSAIQGGQHKKDGEHEEGDTR